MSSLDLLSDISALVSKHSSFRASSDLNIPAASDANTQTELTIEILDTFVHLYEALTNRAVASVECQTELTDHKTHNIDKPTNNDACLYTYKATLSPLKRNKSTVRSGQPVTSGQSSDISGELAKKDLTIKTYQKMLDEKGKNDEALKIAY